MGVCRNRPGPFAPLHFALNILTSNANKQINSGLLSLIKEVLLFLVFDGRRGLSNRYLSGSCSFFCVLLIVWPFNRENLTVGVELERGHRVAIAVICTVVAHLELCRRLRLLDERPRDPSPVCPTVLPASSVDNLNRDVMPVVLISFVTVDHVVAWDGCSIRSSCLRRSSTRFRGRR